VEVPLEVAGKASRRGESAPAPLLAGRRRQKWRWLENGGVVVADGITRYRWRGSEGGGG